MPNVIASLCVVALVSLLGAAPVAHAVCLDPKTFISGYHLPLNEEIRSTRAIVIGKVTKSQYLQEDPTDPEGITAYIYTVQILQRLKGRVPRIVNVRNENDSGRYAMDVGEKHLLFLSTQGEHFLVDSCGNSSPLPQGDAVLKRVEAKLGRTSNAP
jgi:hypothetical protein